MPTLRILSLNAASQDLRLCGLPLYCPVPHTRERLAALPEALSAIGADIVCLQEMFHPRLQQQLHHALRHVFPHAAGFARRGPALRLHSEFLVLSRFPLLADQLHRFHSAAFEERLFTSKGFHAFGVTIPGVGPIEVLNVHFTAGGLRAHPQSPAMERIRANQLNQVIAHVAGGRPAIVAGDLNAGPQSSVHLYRQVLDAGFIDAFEQAGGSGVSWDPSNPLVAKGRENFLPPQRIDHVFLSRSLAARMRPVDSSIVLCELDVETVQGRVPVSDHYGVLAVLEYGA